MKRESRRVRSRQGSALGVHLEGLESRRFLSTSVMLGDVRIFAFNDGSHGTELWKETDQGTELVRDIYGQSQGSNPRDMYVVNDRVLFFAASPPGQAGVVSRVFSTDGTTAGTIILQTPGDTAYDLMMENGVVYFMADVENNPVDVRYQTDGTLVGTVPAAASPVGLLRVNGTAGDDTILIRRAADDPNKLEGVVNGEVVSAAPISAVDQLVVHALGGADEIEIDSSLSVLTKVYAGEGNDTFFGGSGADRVYGGDGNDWIGGFAGNDILYGEAGNDRMFGGDGRDYLDGGAGADVLRGEAGQDRLVVKSGEDDFKGNSGDILILVVTP